jgi:hypothetical protein
MDVAQTKSSSHKVTPAYDNYNDKLKEDEMDRAYGTHGEEWG